MRVSYHGLQETYDKTHVGTANLGRYVKWFPDIFSLEKHFQAWFLVVLFSSE